MNTVLLISNVSPADMGDVGAGRIEKIQTQQELLQEFGWEQIIAKIPSGRILPLGITRCLRLCAQHDVDVVLSISEPIHLHLAGLFVSKSAQLPWAAHARDSHFHKPGKSPGAFERRFRKVVERAMVKYADVVLWDDRGGMLPEGYFERTYPQIEERKFTRLPPIGYVSEKFQNVSAESHELPTVTFAGSFYQSLTPYEFLDSLAAYVDRSGDRAIQFDVYGDWSKSYDNHCERLGISDIVTHHGWIAHDELVPKMLGSDVLLHIAGSEPKHDFHIGTKVYDYIGAKRPILVIGDPTFEAAKLVTDNGLGIAVPGDDPTAIADALDRLIARETDFDPTANVYRQFSRENRIEQLAESLNSIHDNQ